MLAMFVDATNELCLLSEKEIVSDEMIEEIIKIYGNVKFKYLIDSTKKLSDLHDSSIYKYDFDFVNNKILLTPKIKLATDKTTILSDGMDTATITSDYICDWYDESGNLVDSQTKVIYVTSLNTGFITIKAVSQNNGHETISIEVV